MGFGDSHLLTSVMDRASDSNGFCRKVWDGSALDDGIACRSVGEGARIQVRLRSKCCRAVATDVSHMVIRA